MANIGKYKMSQVIGLLEHNARTDERAIAIPHWVNLPD